MKQSVEPAVQSYCFRSFPDNRETARLVKQSGASAVEVCGAHADFDDEKGWKEIARIYEEEGVRIVSIGVERFSGDRAAVERRFACAAAAGAGHVSIDFAPADAEAVYGIVRELAPAYGITCGIHNHGGRHWLGSVQMLSHVLGEAPRGIGVCLDTAWAIQAGEDPVKAAATFGNRLTAVHVKDFVFDSAGRPTDVVIGTGNLDLPALLKVLKENDFSGPLIIEYEGDPENPLPAVRACVEKLRAET